LPTADNPPTADIAPTEIRIELAGAPQGKGRPRMTTRGGFPRAFTPEKTRTYEGMIRTAAMAAISGRARLEGPIVLTIIATFDVPASYSKKQRAAALGGLLLPTKRPDIDNIAKVWADALNGVVFQDDVQIVSGHYRKQYGTEAKVVAIVSPYFARAVAP
jgi:Holliday junction resolvase RusA-like endonuclease